MQGRVQWPPSLAELEEVAVPTDGLDDTGCLREEFGEFTAEVRITGTDSTELRWIRQDGREQKSVPAQVKESFAEEWKEFKRTVQEAFLPFEGDGTLAVILSKAFLLANDRSIKDRSILSQINPEQQ